MSTKAAARLLTLVMLAAIGLAGTASAAPPADPVARFQPGAYDSLLFPETEQRTIEMTLQFSCSVAELGTIKSLTGTFRTASVPATATAVISPAQVTQAAVDGGQCTDESIRHNMTTRLTVVATRGSLAYVPLRFEVQANLTIEPPAGDPKRYGPYSANVTILPEYLALANHAPATYHVPVNGGRAVLRLQTTSFSNGESVVTFGATPRPADRLRVVTPVEQHVPSPIVDKPHSTVESIFQMYPSPAAEHGFLNVVISATVRSVDPRSNSTDEQSITISVDNRSVFANTPSPGVPAMAVVAGLVLALLGRRRRV